MTQRLGARWMDLFPKARLFALSKNPFLVGLGVVVAGGEWSQKVGYTILLVSLIWLFLYVLNESSDLELENDSKVSLRLKIVLFFLFVLLILAACFLSLLLGLLIIMTILIQIAYSLKPLRLKRLWQSSLLTIGISNPVLRMFCGRIWGVHPLPAVVWITFLSLHLASAITTRMFQKERDAMLGYSIIPSWAENLRSPALLIGYAGLWFCCLSGILGGVFYLYALLGLSYSVYCLFMGKRLRVKNSRAYWPILAGLLLIGCVNLFLWNSGSPL